MPGRAARKRCLWGRTDDGIATTTTTATTATTTMTTQITTTTTKLQTGNVVHKTADLSGDDPVRVVPRRRSCGTIIQPSSLNLAGDEVEFVTS